MSSEFKDIKLLEPRIEGGMPFLQALHNRKSSRDYTPNKELSLQQISEILYCAYGFNDPKQEHRTVASGMTIFPLEVYAVLPNGIYHYEPKEHLLKALKQEVISKQNTIIRELKEEAEYYKKKYGEAAEQNERYRYIIGLLIANEELKTAC